MTRAPFPDLRSVVAKPDNSPRGAALHQQLRGAQVRLEALRKTFGAVVAVDDVSLEIRAGEFLTLLGPSGSGKTTTLVCIAGFAIPTAGEVFIGATRVTVDPPFRRNVGMVFQNYALFPHMTVAENLAFPLKMRKLGRSAIAERVEWALALVQLEGFGARYPRQLSGGQQQRVALARAVVFEPPVLLMDEPLGALDKKLRGDMQLELKHLQQRLGITVVYVTHDQEEALTMSDRIAVMHRGRLEQVGTPLELYESPRTRFVADFIGDSNFFEGSLAATAGGHALRTASGLDLPAAPGTLRAGDPAAVFLRPEKIWLASPGAGPGIEGVVVETVYLGEATTYVVRTDAGDVVRVKVQNLSAVPAAKVGERVLLRWDPTVAVVQAR